MEHEITRCYCLLISVLNVQSPEVFYKNSCPQKMQYLQKWKMQYLCRNLFLIKLQEVWPATLLKRETNTCFFVNTAKFLGTPILKNICQRLLLNVLTVSLKTPQWGELGLFWSFYCQTEQNNNIKFNFFTLDSYMSVKMILFMVIPSMFPSWPSSLSVFSFLYSVFNPLF